MAVEQALAAPGAAAKAATLPLDSLVLDGGIDAAKLRALASQYTQQVLWVTPASPTELPPLHGLSDAEKAAIGELVHDECRAEHLPKLNLDHAPRSGRRPR